MLRQLIFLTFTGALALRISPVVRRAPAVSMMQDECVITTLDASASTVFGKHYNMEAVVCADNGLADFGHECHKVMVDGNLVWACAVESSPVVDYATEAAERDARLEAKMSATRSANDNLFTQMAKALENFKLPEMDFAAFGVGPMGNRVQ